MIGLTIFLTVFLLWAIGIPITNYFFLKAQVKRGLTKPADSTMSMSICWPASLILIGFFKFIDWHHDKQKQTFDKLKARGKDAK